MPSPCFRGVGRQMNLKRLILPVCGAILLAGCGESGDYFEKAPDQSIAALKSAYFPARTIGGPIKSSRTFQGEGGVVITALLDQDGSEMLRIVTTVAAEGAGSRVKTELAPPNGTGEMPKLDTASVANFARAHVARVIEGRSVDLTAGTAMAGSAVGERAGAAATAFSYAEEIADENRDRGQSDDWGTETGGGDWAE